MTDYFKKTGQAFLGNDTVKTPSNVRAWQRITTEELIQRGLKEDANQ
jgi:hypothetical protein